MRVRAVEQADLPFLWDMLWEATAVSAEMRALGKGAALTLPSVHKYLRDWGRDGDAGVIAVDPGDQPLGAAWYRLFARDDQSYGFVASDVPEVTIGVAPSRRAQRVGTNLLAALVATARRHRPRAVSLSVDRQNPARRLYERQGFRDAGTDAPNDPSRTLILYI